jgi:hypothetical protein
VVETTAAADEILRKEDQLMMMEAVEKEGVAAVGALAAG